MVKSFLVAIVACLVCVLMQQSVRAAADTLIWPMLPGESISQLAQRLYPDSEQIQQRFIQQSLHLSRQYGVMLEADQVLTQALLIRIPHSVTLEAPIQPIIRRDTGINAQNPENSPGIALTASPPVLTLSLNLQSPSIGEHQPTASSRPLVNLALLSAAQSNSVTQRVTDALVSMTNLFHSTWSAMLPHWQAFPHDGTLQLAYAVRQGLRTLYDDVRERLQRYTTLSLPAFAPDGLLPQVRDLWRQILHQAKSLQTSGEWPAHAWMRVATMFGFVVLGMSLGWLLKRRQQWAS